MGNDAVCEIAGIDSVKMKMFEGVVLILGMFVISWV